MILGHFEPGCLGEWVPTCHILCVQPVAQPVKGAHFSGGETCLLLCHRWRHRPASGSWLAAVQDDVIQRLTALSTHAEVGLPPEVGPSVTSCASASLCSFRSCPVLVRFPVGLQFPVTRSYRWVCVQGSLLCTSCLAQPVLCVSDVCQEIVQKGHCYHIPHTLIKVSV